MQLDVVVPVPRSRPQEHVLDQGLTAQVLLGQRRPLVGRVRLRADQDDPSLEPLRPQRGGCRSAGQVGPDDDERRRGTAHTVSSTPNPSMKPPGSSSPSASRLNRIGKPATRALTGESTSIQTVPLAEPLTAHTPKPPWTPIENQRFPPLLGRRIADRGILARKPQPMRTSSSSPDTSTREWRLPSPEIQKSQRSHGLNRMAKRRTFEETATLRG